VKYRHEIEEAAVKALTIESTDQEIAAALAGYLLAGTRYPLKLSLNHNAKVAPCPVRIDRPGVKQSSVTIIKPTAARMWIIDALMRGYEVTATTQLGPETKSIADVKRSIESKQRMDSWRARVAAGEEDEDEIPF
jgi:hypothetical protein